MSVIYFIFQQTMLFTIPLMIVALGGMFSERSGVVNIALEGIMTMGAFTGILFLNMTGGRMSGQMQLLLAILISTATGAVFAFFHAYASINMKANQTISATPIRPSNRPPQRYSRSSYSSLRKKRLAPNPNSSRDSPPVHAGLP